MKNLKMAFFGTPDFSIPTLEILNSHINIKICYVVSMPDRPAGRGQKLQTPPVAEYAKIHKLPLIQTENINNDEKAKNLLLAADLDFILVLAFAQFLRADILNLPTFGCFNIHTSILPKYRGAAPIQYALLNGDSFTGVSIQKMVLKMDAGDLVHFNQISISDSETGGMLYSRLKFLSALSTYEFLEKLIKNNIQYTPQLLKGQDEKDFVSFAPTIKKTDGHIDFKEMEYTAILNKLRAFDPWPGIYCFLGKQRLKILSVENVPPPLGLALNPGESSFENRMLLVGSKDKTLRLKFVQLEGKKACTDTDLLNGLTHKLDQLSINP